MESPPDKLIEGIFSMEEITEASPIPLEVSLDNAEDASETTEPPINLLDQTPAGYRLFARAAEINTKRALKRREAKDREEQQTVGLFQPQLFTKQKYHSSTGKFVILIQY